MNSHSQQPNSSIERDHLPWIMYGTAWKEAQTERLVELALQQGFRGIDTANQRKHYDEASVGRALTKGVKSGLVKRDDLFLQTKFTFLHGQDHRLPYDPAASIPIQVQQSFASSLEHLGTEIIDSYVLHGPSRGVGLGPEDWDAWHAMEEIHDTGRARMLGVSNVNLEQLQLLCQKARVRPRFVQNRCYAVRGWDRRVREFCKANGIVYQGFSLLTANRELLSRPEMARIAKRYGRTVNQIAFRFSLDVGMLPLTGTTNADHMREDLEISDFQMDPEDMRLIEDLGTT
jgi:diketogulonate reductase-like aldo/keto reductase